MNKKTLFKTLSTFRRKSNIQSCFTLSKANGQTGFTLVELIVYMGLLSVMVLVLTDIFTSIIDNQLRSRNTSNVADDGRYVYSRFIYDVNRASNITQPANFGSTSAQLGLTIDGQNYTYSLANNNLIITAPGGSDQLNGYGSSVSALLFTKVGTSSAKSTVRINFKINGLITTRGANDEEDFQTTAGLR